MTFVRDVTEVELPGDGINYEVLYEAVQSVIYANVPGMLCEIGIRRGGGIRTMIDAMLDAGKRKLVVGVDPYGDIEYPTDGPGGKYSGSMRRDFTNDMRNETMANLYLYCQWYNINFQFFNMEDIEFFARFQDGVPYYDKEKSLAETYAVVHIDGPHNTGAVMMETVFFWPRCTRGSVLVYDNVDYYDHGMVERHLLCNGWEKRLTSTNKWSYTNLG